MRCLLDYGKKKPATYLAGGPPQRIMIQQPGDDVGLLVQQVTVPVSRESNLSGPEIGEHLDPLHASGQRRRAHLEEDDPQAVEVNLLVVHDRADPGGGALANLWCSVESRADQTRHVLLNRDRGRGRGGVLRHAAHHHAGAGRAAKQKLRGGQAKVADLDVVLTVDENVDGFKVAVNHALGVDVNQAINNLPGVGKQRLKKSVLWI